MKAELSRKVVLGAKRTELPKNGLGNTDEIVFTVCGFEGTIIITEIQRRFRNVSESFFAL